MKWLRFTVVIVIASVLQASALLNVFAVTQMSIRPSVLLMLLIYFAINCDSYDAVITSFAIGFAADMSSAVMGPHILSYGLIGTAVAHIRKIILLKQTSQQAITILAAGVMAGIIAAALGSIKASVNTGFFEIFASSMYSAILWFVLKWPTVAIGKWLGVGVFRFGIRDAAR